MLLKHRHNQTAAQRTRLRDLVRHNLKAVRAMLLRETFEPFWTYRSVDWAGAFLDAWCVQVMRSQLDRTETRTPFWWSVSLCCSSLPRRRRKSGPGRGTSS